MGQKDMVEKILEDYEDVFADIVNVLLFQGEQVVKPENLVPANIQSQYKADDGKLHEQERDVAKIEKRNGVHFALYGLENQEKIEKYMPFQIFGYEGAFYRSQYSSEKAEKYPVVTLVLYYGERHWTQPKQLKSLLNIPSQLDAYVNDVKVNVFEISWLSDEQIELFQSDFWIIADYFVQKRKNVEYVPSHKEIKHVDAFLKMMSVFANDDRYEKVIDEVKKEGGPVTMCTVLDSYEKKGHEEGRDEILYKLVKRGVISMDEAVENSDMSYEELEERFKIMENK